MVGAGFSLNAEPLPGAKAKFPTWSSLALAIYERLYPLPPNESSEQAEKRKARSNAANFLRIASEYEAAFGKTQMDALIAELTPDSQYVPGRLHRMLLELPWADVFTTNYDTLLERTEVDGRSYRPVTKPNELHVAFSPRIVKLHGSFPAQTPFIISEEDYRKYPRDFAPFVNSVQQSLLENSFVLLGFSGDDPNFLSWTGWIRDELGEAHAPIYLVGPLSLGTAQRKLLAMRGVTPIDLSPVFANRETPQGIHSASLTWFLECLKAVRPARPERWPKLAPKTFSPTIGLAPLVGAAPEPEEVETRGPNSVSTETLQKLRVRWQREREMYPGWIVAPEETRSALWRRTKEWLHPVLEVSKSWQSTERVRLFQELAWRLNVSMVPMFSEMVEPFTQALFEIFNNESITQTFANPEITNAWLTVAFALWRDARESYDLDLWSKWKDQVDRVIRFDQTWIDRRNYEVALYSMWDVDRPAVRSILIGWQPSMHSPIAMIWKAGLLAEIDELGESRSLLREALTEVRKALRIQGQNIELLSLEGWCMFLVGVTGFSTLNAIKEDPRDEFWDRWDELKAWDCNPWVLLQYVENILSGTPPQVHQTRRTRSDFDPGRITVSHTFAYDDLTPLLPAFAFLRMHEQAGLPMRVSMVDITGDALKNACRWLASSHGFWAPAHLVRAGKHKDLTVDILSRSQVARMDVTLAKRIYNWCLNIFESERISTISSNAPKPAHLDLLEVASEVLSRLAIRVDAEQLARTFPILQQFYKLAAVGFRPRLQPIYQTWSRRLFDAADEGLLKQWLPELIQASLVEDGTSSPSLSQCDPMQEFPWWRLNDPPVSVQEPSVSISRAIDWLLKRIRGESGQARQKPIERLIGVYRTGLMSTAQAKTFGEVLWEDLSPDKLPDLPRLYVSAFLDLPSPENVGVEANVKRCILALPMVNYVKRNADGSVVSSVVNSSQRLLVEAPRASRPLSQLSNRTVGCVDWTLQEAFQLLLKVKVWWENDKIAIERADKNKSTFLDDDEAVRQAASLVGAFLSRVVLPQMPSASQEQWDQVLGLMNDLRATGVYPTVALPYVLLSKPQEKEVVAITVQTDLDSAEESRVCAAAEGLKEWLCLSESGKVPAPPGRLARLLAEKVALRQRQGLSCCIEQLTSLIRELPDAIEVDLIQFLIASLIPWNDRTLTLPEMAGYGGEFDEDEMLTLRPMIGRLAAALSMWHEKLQPKLPEPVPISKWRNWCGDDPLPEVRRAFMDVRRREAANDSNARA